MKQEAVYLAYVGLKENIHFKCIDFAGLTALRNPNR